MVDRTLKASVLLGNTAISAYTICTLDGAVVFIYTLTH